jgi:uncharacterized membrane protein YccF (DUF307 family)
VRLLLTLIWLVFGGIFKLIGVSLTPFGREIVDIDQARRYNGQPTVTL